MRNIVGALHTQLTHRLEPDVLALLGDLIPWAVLALGTVDDLVVNVRDVGSQADLKSRIGEVSAQDVVYQGGSTMTQVGWPVDSGAA